MKVSQFRKGVPLRKHPILCEKSTTWFICYIRSIVVILFSFSNAGADIVSDFSTGVQGWQIVSLNDPLIDNYTVLATYSAVHEAAGGNPGGYISVADPDVGAFMFSAPGSFLGDVGGATGLSWNIVYSNHQASYQPSDLILEGSGQRLLWKSNPDIIPGTAWSVISVAFSPGLEWRVGTSGGPLATAGDFQNVLEDLTALYIRGEYTTGLTETTGIDNVTLKILSFQCDLNGDGIADAADAGVMFGNWGNAGLGDCNRDGIVDAADAGILFGQWTGDSMASLTVPEPAMVYFLVGSAAFAADRRRRFRAV